MYKLKSVDIQEDWIGTYDLVTELYEFGKYTDFQPPKKSHLPFFKKKCLKAKYDEYDFMTITPEFLEYIIESYSNMVADYYNKMLTPFFGKQTGEWESDKPSTFFKFGKNKI